jgi:uncharacterized protein YkwD
MRIPVLRRHTRLASAAAAAALLALAAAPQGAAASGCVNANVDPSSASMDILNRATVCLLNHERTSRGLSRLRRSSQLDLASVRHARDMVRRKYFEHGDFVGRIKATNYLSGVGSWSVGENIAWGTGGYGTPAGIVKSWMNSSGHRANILSSRIREIGIGIARGVPRSGLSGGGTYVTDFGARG